MKRSLFSELKRRNVIRAAVLYVGAVWALSQGFAQLAPYVGAPDWTVRWFLVAAAIGFPFFVAFAWFYEFTPEGLKRESEIDPAQSITAHTGRKLDFAIIGVLSIAVVLLLTDRFVLHHGVNEAFAAPANSIAVLPFADESPKKDHGYFSDGISEDLLNLLTKVPQLQVTARASSFYFKGKDIRIQDIARQLHVAHLLEGSVQKAGDEVRITVQLVDAATDTQRWSQTYDRKFDDVFRIQDEIAGKVVKALKVKLLGAVPTVRPTDPKAYALYLQARELGRQHKIEAYKKSDTLYRQVLAIDPRYAPGWNGLAKNYYHETGIGALSNQEGMAHARDAAEKALAIDPDYAPAHAALGFIAMYGNNDLTGAAEHLERALALDPTDLYVLRNTAALLANLGRLNESVALYHAIVRRDPVNVYALYDLGYNQRLARRYDAAIATERTLLGLSPNQGIAHFQIGVALLLEGDANGALSEFQQESSKVWRMFGLPMAYCALGRKPEADQVIAALIAKYEKNAPYNIAYDYALCGNADKAFEWLDKAVEYKDPGLSEIVEENLFDKIHSDPRWLPFMRKLGKAPDQLAKIKFKVASPKILAQSATSSSMTPN